MTVEELQTMSFLLSKLYQNNQRVSFLRSMLFQNDQRVSFLRRQESRHIYKLQDVNYENH